MLGSMSPFEISCRFKIISLVAKWELSQLNSGKTWPISSM